VADYPWLGDFGVAYQARLVGVFAVEADIDRCCNRTVLIRNGFRSTIAGNLTPLLRRVLFVG